MNKCQARELVVGSIVTEKAFGIEYGVVGRVKMIPNQIWINRRQSRDRKIFDQLNVFPLREDGGGPLHHTDSLSSFNYTGRVVTQEEWLVSFHPFLRFLATNDLIGQKLEVPTRDGYLPVSPELGTIYCETMGGEDASANIFHCVKRPKRMAASWLETRGVSFTTQTISIIEVEEGFVPKEAFKGERDRWEETLAQWDYIARFPLDKNPLLKKYLDETF